MKLLGLQLKKDGLIQHIWMLKVKQYQNPRKTGLSKKKTMSKYNSKSMSVIWTSLTSLSMCKAVLHQRRNISSSRKTMGFVVKIKKK